jgi:hypothetical protein
MAYNIMKIKNIVLGIGIIILTIFVVVYGIRAFYPAPKYEDFCKVSPNAYINSSAECIAAGGKWDANIYPKPASDAGGWCDAEYSCRKEYNKINEVYSRNVFILSIPLGILIIGLGAYLFSLEAVGAGLMGGGVGTLIFGVGSYWEYSGNWLRFIISLIGLVILVWFAYWFNKNYQK